MEEYEGLLTAWQDSDTTRAAAEHWNSIEFWSLLAEAGWRSRSATQTFIEHWVQLVRAGAPLSQSRPAHELIERRERQLKGSRSRFVNADALDAWQGGSGMGRLTFRWAEAKTLVRDIHRGLEAPVA